MAELDLSSFPEALALFDGPLSMVLGSSDAQKRPHFARAQGVRRGEADLALCDTMLERSGETVAMFFGEEGLITGSEW